MKLLVLTVFATLVLAAPGATFETPADQGYQGRANVLPAAPRAVATDPVPIAEQLAQLTPAERANAVIRLACEDERAREAENCWNSGHCAEALALIQELNPPDIGINWRVPIAAPESDWGEPVLVSARDSVIEVELEADTATGNIFAFLLFQGDGHTATFSCNISTDGGATWAETDDFWANYDIPSIAASVVGGHAYIAVNRSYFAYISLFRYTTSDGQPAAFPGGSFNFNVATGAANTFEEVALASNHTFSNDRIYAFYNTTTDSSRIVGYSTTTFDTFNFTNEPVEVERGLDIAWNYYPSGHPLVFSFINPASNVRVYGYNLGSAIDTLFALAHAANGPYTALTAWKDTITVVFDQTRSAVTQTRYLVQYDTAGVFLQGGLGDTTLGFSRNGAATGRRGDGVAVTYWQYPQATPGQAYRYRNYSGTWTPAVSIQTGNTRSDRLPAIERIAPGTFGTLFFRGAVGQVLFNSSAWMTGIAQSPGNLPGLARRPATIVRGILNLQPAISNLQSAMVLMDATGRRVADLAPGANDLRHLSPGIYFLRQGEAAQPVKVILQH